MKEQNLRIAEVRLSGEREFFGRTSNISEANGWSLLMVREMNGRRWNMDCVNKKSHSCAILTAPAESKVTIAVA